MTDTCVVCDGRAELVRGFREVRAGDRTVTIEGEFMQCSDCGERFYRAGQMREFQRAATEFVRKEEGLLAPSDIVGLRERYGLSQAALEHLMNAGPKTVGRWERGTVSPSGPADTLLRELIDSPALVRKLAAQRGVSLHDRQPEPVRLRAGTRPQAPVQIRPEAFRQVFVVGSLDGVLEEYSNVPAGMSGEPYFKSGAQWQQPMH